MKRTVIPIGPYHPLQEEAGFFQLQVEGEKVLDIDVDLGYNHRGIEKICEARTYDQIPFVVERICGICSTSHPLAYVQAVEEIAEVNVPERALYIRTIVAELERLHSHLLWLGLAGHFIGYNTVFMWAWRYREPVLDIMEEVTGNRNNYAMMKVGGVRRDLLEDDIPKIRRMVEELRPALDMFVGAVVDDPVIHARTKGVGILTPEEARLYGAVGPTARASGLALDVRRDDPYAVYDRLDWNVIIWESGDVFGKAAVRLMEIRESIKIILQCLEQIAPGEIDAMVKEIPPGEGIGHVEAPRGETFHYVRSDGSNRPVRHKVRAPSYTNVPTFKATCIGQTISDVTIILAAVDPCYSCTERMAVVKGAHGKHVLDGHDLISLSQRQVHEILHTPAGRVAQRALERRLAEGYRSGGGEAC
jgi:Ni,Fe-hydrogenase III large subunit